MFRDMNWKFWGPIGPWKLCRCDMHAQIFKFTSKKVKLFTSEYLIFSVRVH